MREFIYAAEYENNRGGITKRHFYEIMQFLLSECGFLTSALCKEKLLMIFI